MLHYLAFHSYRRMVDGAYMTRYTCSMKICDVLGIRDDRHYTRLASAIRIRELINEDMHTCYTLRYVQTCLARLEKERKVLKHQSGRRRYYALKA